MAQHTAAIAPAVPITQRLFIFLHSVAFVLGFSSVFIVLFGGGFGLLKGFLLDNKVEISRIAGVIIILFGLATLRVIKIPFLYYDTRRQFAGRPELGYVSSFAMGTFFAAGWTPCIGTVLGAILNLPGQGSPVTHTLLLATAYSLGLAIPFLILGLLMDRMVRVLRRMTRYLHAIEIFTGVFLIGLGVLLLTGEFPALVAQLGRGFSVPDSGLPGAEDPTLLIAFLGGLLSFFSPCVLPLVPVYLGYLSGHVVNRASVNAGPAP